MNSLFEFDPFTFIYSKSVALKIFNLIDSR